MVSYTSLLEKLYRKKCDEISKYVDLKVLIPRYRKTLWAGDKKIYFKPDKEEYPIKTGRVLFLSNLHFAVFISQLKKILKNFKPDIVDLEDEPFNGGSLQMSIYRDIFSPKSKIVYHASQNVVKSYPFPFNVIEKYNFKRASRVLARSESAKKVLLHKGMSPEKVKVVPHGVDTGYFKPEKKNSDDSKFRIGFIGALTEQKGVETLFAALEGVDFSWELVIAGDGEYKEKLKRIAVAKGVDKNIKWLGRQPQEKIPKILNTLDIFVLPSITIDGQHERFGRVLIEAMGCGIPTVGSTSGEIPKTIGDSGLIFTEGKPEDLKKQILKLKENKNLRRKLSKKGRQRVKQKFSWKSIAKDTVNIYRRALER
ncbi:MAG: glycosyltransferase family 4 protein [Elusimicrobiota bacterium]